MRFQFRVSSALPRIQEPGANDYKFVGAKTSPAVSVQTTISDFGLALTAFVGISGYLPFTVVGAIQTFVALIRKLVGRLTECCSQSLLSA